MKSVPIAITLNRLIPVLLCAAFFLVATESVHAQETVSVPTLPHYPTGFTRGNGDGTVGNYLSLIKFVPILLLFILWVKLSYWVDKDSGALRVRQEFWNTVFLCGGVAAFLLAVSMPHFALSLLSCLTFAGVPLGMYIYERNMRVPEGSRVMTPRHLKKVANHYLAKVGLMVGGQGDEIVSSGPAIQFIGKSADGGDRMEDRNRQVENSKGYLSAKELVYDAILRRATDIHLEPQEDNIAVRIRIDGFMFPAEPFDRETGSAVTNVFKILGAMDISERRRSQDGSFQAIMNDRQIDFRVATQRTRHGEKMSLRILDQGGALASLSKLGMRKRSQESFRKTLMEPHGLVILCGPTGSGKSTTLYAGLSEIDHYEKNIVTIEDPIEYMIEGANQIEINKKSGQTFAESLRSVLRQDPDVVMVGEIRDAETASIACQAANTGHMVLSTVHANDTATAVFRMLELGVEPFMIANSISLLVGQRLLRRLCKECRQPYKPKPEFLKQAHLSPDKVSVLYKPPPPQHSECLSCGGTGYYGRVGVYEFLHMSDRMRDLIRDKSSINSIRAEARKNGMHTMREEALQLVVRGITSVDELLRVVK
ncbi:GspE/PulE family protein [Calycomorphotria hydatis]|nr:GspE/PulE family protein [Calycomorphotria hydatis]